MITRQTIDIIMAEARIEEVVGDFVHLKKSGSSYKALSPFSNEKTPSFFVSPSKGIFKDFSSGKGGNAVTFLMDHEQMTYPEALRYLAKKYNVPIEEEDVTDEQKEEQNKRESLYIVNDYAQEFFQEQLLKTDAGKAIGLSYFKERGFTEETIQTFKLGYSPEEWDAFLKSAESKGYKTEYLLETGLVKERDTKKYDAYRGRVIFPIHNLSGRPIGFGARTLKTDKKIPKYLNSPESEIYHKSKIVYGIYQAKSAIVKEDNCLLVEGYTDVLALHQAGIKNVVASSGTALTEDQVRLVKRYTNNVTILYDGDPAGIKASFRGIDLILEEGMNVKVVLFPEGEDPDSFSKKLGAEELNEYISENSKDFIRFKTSVLIDEVGDDPMKRTNLIHDIVNSIALIPDHIARSIYTKECSTLLDISEKALISELNKARRKWIDKKKVERERAAERSQARQQQPGPPPPPDFIPPPTEEGPQPIEEWDREEMSPSINPAEYQEKDIVRLLLNYGNHDIQVKVLREDEDTGKEQEEEVLVSVGSFIIHDIINDDLNFLDQTYQEIFDMCTEMLEENDEINIHQLTQHESDKMRSTIADLLTEKYELHEWDKREIYVSTEDMKLQKAVQGALYSFKTKKIEHLIHENQQELKKAYGKGEDILPILEAQTQLEKVKIELSKLQGITILR